MIELEVVRGAERGGPGGLTTKVKRQVELVLRPAGDLAVVRVTVELAWTPGGFRLLRRWPRKSDWFDDPEPRLRVRESKGSAAGIKYLALAEGEPVPLGAGVDGAGELARVTLQVMRSSYRRGMREPDPELLLEVRARVVATDDRGVAHAPAPPPLVLIAKQHPRKGGVRRRMPGALTPMSVRDQEILTYLHEMRFLTEQTITKLWFRNLSRGKEGGARFDRKSGKWASSTAKNRIRELVKAKYIRPANPRKARNPEQRENWKMFWWERPYLLGPRGIEALQGEMKRVEMFLPVKDGSVPKFPPSPTRISVHGSNDTKHEMGLVELRYLLEQATRKVGGGLGLDLRGESEPGPPRGWISERSLFYHPRWPMFRKGKHRSLNRPVGRHPDAILEWRGGGWRGVRPSLGRIAVEYESSQRAQNPKSVSQYTQITESYLRLLCAKQGKDAYLHWVLYVFEEASAAKRFLRNILPQVPRKLARAWYRRSPDMLPELFMTAIWPKWREQLVRAIRSGKRMPLPVQHRAWNRERHEMAAPREMDFWQVGDQDSFGWHPPEAAMSWWRDEGEASLRCFIANTRAAAELAGELLGKPGDALEAMREKESDGWTWTKDREPRVFFFPPETPVWVYPSQRGEEKAVLRVALLTRSLRDLDRWSVALEGFTKRELVSFAEDWTVQHRNNVRDPDYMQPNGTLSDEAYLRFQRESTRMRPQEASFAPVPVFRDVASFRKIAAARDDERLPGDAKLRSAMQVYKIEATSLRCRGRYHSLWRIADDRARPWVVEGKYLKRRDAKSWWVVGEFDGLDHDVEGDEEE